MLRGRFIAIQAYLKKKENSQINNLTTPKATKRNEEPQGQQKERNLKNQGRNKCKRKETIAKINKTKSWFFEKTNKIDRSLAKFIKKKRWTTQINKIANEKREVTTDNTEI